MSYWKIYFTEVSQISISPSEAKNGMKELIYWKKFLMKVAQQSQKPPDESNQIWATTSGKKDTWATSEVTVDLSYDLR
jgi:hypothetical protein